MTNSTPASTRPVANPGPRRRRAMISAASRKARLVSALTGSDQYSGPVRSQ